MPAVALVALVVLIGANTHSQEPTPVGYFGKWGVARYVDEMDPNADYSVAVIQEDDDLLMVVCGGKKQLILTVVVEDEYLGDEPATPLIKIDEHETLQFFGDWRGTYRPSEAHRMQYWLNTEQSYERGQLHDDGLTLINQMKAGQEIKIRVWDEDGTPITKAFSLSGFAEAYSHVFEECGGPTVPEYGEPFEATGRLIFGTNVRTSSGKFITWLPERTYVRITRRSATLFKIETKDRSGFGWVGVSEVRIQDGQALEGSGEAPESDARKLVEDAQSAPSGDSWASAFRMGEEGIEPPVLVRKELPEYTAAAKRADISGDVYIEPVVTEEGTVVDPVLIGGLSDPELNRRAMESILLWRFEPGLKDGQPVPVIVLFTVTFRIHQDSLPPGSRDIGIVTRVC